MNWKETRDILDGKGKRRGPRDSVKIARNTYLERGRSFLPPMIRPPEPGSKYRRSYNYVNGKFCNDYDAAGNENGYPDNAIGLRLHATYVVIFTPHWTELNTGGWPTKVTADRMSYVSGVNVGGGAKEGWSVYLGPYREGYWQDGHPFYDGIRISADGTRLMKTQPHKPANFQPLKTESGFEMAGVSWRGY